MKNTYNYITSPLPNTLLINKEGIRTSLCSYHQNWPLDLDSHPILKHQKAIIPCTKFYVIVLP